MNEKKFKKKKKEKGWGWGGKQKNEKLEQALLSTAHSIIQDW